MAIENFLKEIDDKTIGIVWFSKESIEEITELHELFDYLVDGQVGKFLDYAHQAGKDLSKENMYFIGRCFNSQIIVYNTSVSKDFSGNDFNDFKMIVEKLETQDKNKLVVIHPEGFNIPKVINNSEFNVKPLTYS